jgi:2-isopropylmalate synthase
MQRATGIKIRLATYQVTVLTEGVDAQGDVVVEVEHQGRTYRGRAVSPDIMQASARAFLDTLNRIASSGPRLVLQEAV